MSLPAALRPLAALASRYPDFEGQVVWFDAGEFTLQEAEELGMDPEEIAFYAEGLLAEGFHLLWQALADVDAPGDPVILQLTCAQIAPPPAPPLPEGWQLASIPNATGRATP